MHLELQSPLKKICNGTLTITPLNKTATANQIEMMLQNYSDIDYNNVIIDGTNLYGTAPYVVSTNTGDIKITGSSSITAPQNGFAFDVFTQTGTGVPADQADPTVTVDTTGTITGKIEYNASKGGKLTIDAGNFNGDIVIGSKAPETITTAMFVVNGGTFNVSSAAAKELIEAHATIPVSVNVEKTTTLILDIGESYVLDIPSGLNFTKDTSGNYVASYEAGVTNIAIGDGRQVAVTVEAASDPGHLSKQWKLTGDINYSATWKTNPADADINNMADADFKFTAPHDAVEAKKVEHMEFVVDADDAKIGTNTDTLTFSASIENE